MIQFIFFIIVVTFVLLLLSFILKIYVMAMISTMGIIVIGVFILINGMQGINDLLTITIGVICVSLGAYILITGSLEQLEG